MVPARFFALSTMLASARLVASSIPTAADLHHDEGSLEKREFKQCSAAETGGIYIL